MTEFEFTLVISGDLADESVAQALFEGGCDDATFGIDDGIGYGEFFREASTLSEAVFAAIVQIESVPKLRVLHIEPDDIVTMADIADRLERTRESVRLLIAGRRGKGGFPAPISHAQDRGRLWRWSDVAAWVSDSSPEEMEDIEFTAALNAALDLRRRLPLLADGLVVKEIRNLV